MVGYHPSHCDNALIKRFFSYGSAADPVLLGQPGLLQGASTVTAVPSHSSAPQSSRALGSTLGGRVCANKPRQGSAAISPSTPLKATKSRDPTAPSWLVATAPWEDTALHHPVFQPSQVLHHDINKAGDEAGKDADHGTDDPALYLHRPESLRGRQPSDPAATQPSPCQH